jgi:hypothetical protein
MDHGTLRARPTLEKRKGGAPGKPEGKCRFLVALGMMLVWIESRCPTSLEVTCAWVSIMDDMRSAVGVLARMDEAYA